MCLGRGPETSAVILQGLRGVGKQGIEPGMTILSAPIRLRRQAQCPIRGHSRKDFVDTSDRRDILAAGPES